MKTYFAKASDIVRQWYLVDASEKILGRVASKVAVILMGKHKAMYTPNADTGDFVIVVNAKKIRLTGKKLVQKTDYTHSGYPNGHRFTPYGELMEKNPERAVKLAVKGMLPKSKLGDKMLRKLKVFKEEKHDYKVKDIKTLVV